MALNSRGLLQLTVAHILIPFFCKSMRSESYIDEFSLRPYLWCPLCLAALALGKEVSETLQNNYPASLRAIRAINSKFDP